MKYSFRFPSVIGLLLFLTLSLSVAQIAPAAILWTGPNTNFTQSAADYSDELVPGAVSLCRNYSQWLFNPDAGEQGPGPGTPTDTEWAFGSLANYDALSYQSFYSLRNGDLSSLLVGNPMVVHLIHENIYLSLTFSAWPQNGGFFAYTRSTPATTGVLPTVTITNPIRSSVFVAPADLKIQASAMAGSSSVTNVQFFANSLWLGASQSDPFAITAGNLDAGQYNLTAVATAAGVSVTSSVVNISVVTPVAIVLSSQTISNNQFAFDYNVNPGLSYVVQDSSNLMSWVSLATNVPSSNAGHFNAGLVPNGVRFYRVFR